MDLIGTTRVKKSYGSVDIGMKEMKTSNWDRLKTNLNVEKTIRDILRIIKTPDKVYGHGVVSHKQLEKVEQRLTKIEDDLRSIKDKLGMLDNMDRLNGL
tara:strand:+ start:859 stop:1155 length:297 start_codon:yes stop_codon:yes gene_type:complete